jgi:hypothetical protein
MRLVVVAAVSLLLPPTLLAQDDTAAPKDSIIALIDRFLSAPRSNADLWSAIVDSARARSDVVVELTPHVVPWVCTARRRSAEGQALASLLVGAYVAGNMRAQLVSGLKKDEPQAGVDAVVRVYRAVRGRVLDFVDPTAEHWLVADSLGTLPALVDSLSHDYDPTC